jgi:hypothetical protein
MHLQLNPQPTLPQANPNFTSTPRIPSTHPNHTTQQLPPNSPPSIPQIRVPRISPLPFDYDPDLVLTHKLKPFVAKEYEATATRRRQ